MAGDFVKVICANGHAKTVSDVKKNYQLLIRNRFSYGHVIGSRLCLVRRNLLSPSHLGINTCSEFRVSSNITS